MKYQLLSWLAVWLMAAVSVSFAECPATRTARLFVIAGQSNAGGKGTGSELPAEYRIVDPDILAFGKGFKELSPLRPYSRKGFGADNTAFGPEIAFAHGVRSAFPEDILCIAKQTEGGCTIIAWDKDWKRPGWKEELKLVRNENKAPQYPELIRVVRGAVQSLEARPDVATVQIAGMLWVQSERDDRHRLTAAAYEKNLRALIANLRTDLGAPALPFLFADANGRLNVSVLRAGMRRIAAEVPNTALVPNSGLSRVDGVHYDSRGQIELGRRFAEAYLRMAGKKNE